MWSHTRRKNCVNCSVLTGNSAGLRTVFPVVFHTENCAVHSGNPTSSSVYLPTPRWRHLKALDSFIRWASHDKFLFKCHFLLHILRFLFFLDDIMADVASKQQTTALFLSTIVTRTEDTQNWQKKPDKPDRKPVLCQRTFSSVHILDLEAWFSCLDGSCYRNAII